MEDCKINIHSVFIVPYFLGRMTQVKAMASAYEVPVLLIEFDPDKPFYLLQSRSASALRRSDLSPTDLISKLVLLLLHNPKLKLLWTSAPRLTCDIFFDLKRNQAEPATIDPEDPENGKSNESPFNEKLKSLLLKLPGVNEQNYFLVMRRVRNFRDLSMMSLAEIQSILGDENGFKLHRFMNVNLK